MKYDSKALENQMKKTVAAYENNLQTIRASQANAGVLSRVTFEYYGAPTPINTMADIRLQDARTLVIQPWDPALLRPLEKAIQSSELGINPQNDGRVIRLVFPQLTEERRKDLTKQVKKYAEDGKVAVRNIRREAVDFFKKQQKKSEITEDELKKIEKDVQDLTDKYTKKIDDLCAAKEKELMAI